jgi:lambda family phage portal protein
MISGISGDGNHVFSAAIGQLAQILQRSAASPEKRPSGLVGPDGRPLPLSTYNIQRHSATNKGSLKQWVPKRVLSRQQAAYDREKVADRSTDLINNDPHASGIADTFATTVVGTGLHPHPTIDGEILGLNEEQVRAIQTQAKSVFNKWNQSTFADSGRRMNFYALQFLAQRMMLQFGEFLFLVPMLRDTSRPYRIALQSINPMRLKTPSDLQTKDNIIDGVEVGRFGEPVAYWIKKSGREYLYNDHSDHFIRITARRGHRVRVLHGFICNESEQVRGVPFFSPAMKFFRDLNDYLDAELVSNIVTAALALFIETGTIDPLLIAQNLQTITDTAYKSDGSTYDERYQEIIPGQVMYGAAGEKPHILSAQRPGATFGPFVETVEHSIALSLNIPFPVLFKNFKGMSYASYRSAMLEAWRVFKHRRQWLGGSFCQPVYIMLLEEAYLRGELDVDNFYDGLWNLTSAKWIGPPKGQIEPIKEVQADILEIQNNLKTREEYLIEHERDLRSTFDQLSDEQEMMDERNLNEAKIEPGQEADPDEGDGNQDGNE